MHQAQQQQQQELQVKVKVRPSTAYISSQCIVHHSINASHTT
jgi:hypothetical protein